MSDTAFLLGAEITDANLVSCSVAEPDATRAMPDGSPGGEVAFNAATNYTVGTYAYSTITHRIYKNAAGGVNAAQPHLAPTRWIDQGPTNRWAWADWYRSTKTYATSSFSLVVQPGAITDVVMFGLEGVFTARVQVFEAPGGGVLFDRWFSLLYWPSGDPWISYYFDLPQVRSEFEVSGMQPSSTSQVQLDLIGTPGEQIAVGAILFGRYQTLGKGLYGATARQRPFRKFETDDFGEVKIARRGLASDIQATAVIDVADANAIKRAVDEVVDTPVALRITRATYYDFLRGLGLLDVSIEASGPYHCQASIELKGFK